APAAIDWDATLGFREHLFSYGLGVAEAMDTAQRNMGLDWAATQELIRRSASQPSGPVCAGAGTDQLPPAISSLHDSPAGNEAHLEPVDSGGGTPVLMASRHLARLARGPEDYLSIYGHLLKQTRTPVILLWLGEMFDPQLAGYWGSTDRSAATETV